MFSRPANENQVFNLWSTSAVTDTFRLSYNNSAYTGPLSGNSTRQQIEAVLEGLAGVNDVEVEGAGTSRDPWRVKIVDATKDSRGGYFLLQVHPDDADVLQAPADAADAAATTRASISLTAPNDYQRVYYDFSAENVEVRLPAWSPDELEETAPMEATLPPDDAVEESYVPVRFHSKITELGLLELWCVSTKSEARWKLEFSVREEAET